MLQVCTSHCAARMGFENRCFLHFSGTFSHCTAKNVITALFPIVYEGNRNAEKCLAKWGWLVRWCGPLGLVDESPKGQVTIHFEVGLLGGKGVAHSVSC
jgi:hypothetical protein